MPTSLFKPETDILIIKPLPVRFLKNHAHAQKIFVPPGPVKESILFSLFHHVPQLLEEVTYGVCNKRAMEKCTYMKISYSECLEVSREILHDWKTTGPRTLRS